MYNQNSKFDITFNHSHENLVLMPCFKKYWKLFSNKNDAQISRIINSSNINQKVFIYLIKELVHLLVTI